MFYIIVNGKKFLCDSKGKISKSADGVDIELDEATASSLTEFSEENPGQEDTAAVNELKSFIANLATKEAEEAVKALDLVNGFSAEARKAFAKAFTDAQKATEVEALDTKAITASLKAVKAKAGASYEFGIKTISELTSLTGDVIVADRDPMLTRDPVRSPFIEELGAVSSTNSNKVSWVEVINETGAPATTAELATFPTKEYEFGVFGADVLKVAVMAKHSTEILEDAPQLVAFVKEMLTEDLNLKVDEKLLSGSGAPGEFTGILTIAPTFNAGSFAAAIPNANNLDVLRVALANIATAGKGKFQATAIVMNPEDVAMLDLTKGADGHYVMPPFSTSERTLVKGVRVIENTGVTAGTFLVGDFRKLKIANRRGASIQVATENVNDFEKDIFTLRVSRRLAMYVRTNDIGAFVQGDFATATTAILKP